MRVLVVLFSVTLTHADDRVTLRPPDSAGLIVEIGVVADYNDVSLILKGGARPRTFASENVVAVETVRSASHQRGLEQFAAGDITAAAASFADATETEGRAWVRRELLAWLVRCAYRQGDQLAAASRFVELTISDPQHRFWSLAPLGWDRQASSPQLFAAARQWLVQPNEGSQLVGAALLLNDPASRPEALKQINQLARGNDRYIAPLARALQWRAGLATADPSDEELYRWRREIERMPESIRAGPWYTLGQAHARRRDGAESVSAYLKVLIAHADNEELAARSGVEAALALRSLNREADADTILREVVERFPNASATSEARTPISPPPHSGPAG
ncbi:MAG: hypothetical protein R3B90_15430 [Planctomycetaceae bacterium]